VIFPKTEIVKSETSIARQLLGKHSRGNEYASNNRITSVAMQRLCKTAFSTIERLRFVRGPCRRVIKKGREDRLSVEFRDANLPEYELGSR
jgi:hypothetical protein